MSTGVSSDSGVSSDKRLRWEQMLFVESVFEEKVWDEIFMISVPLVLQLQIFS